MDQEVISHSVEETLDIAEEFAKKNLLPGSVVVLRGELGAGKTQFTKGIARSFGLLDEEISSPTYALVNEYHISSSIVERLYHLDCYRFVKPEELLELGVEEYLYPKRAVTIIEWPERIESFLPGGRIEVAIETIAPTQRRIIIRK